MVDQVRAMGDNKSKEEVVFAAGVAHGLSMVTEKMLTIEQDIRSERETRAAGKGTEEKVGNAEDPDAWEA